jgi:hypothetical protein
VIVWAKEQAEAKTLAPKADKVLEALLRQGELPRGEVPEMLNTNLRTAQRAVTSLIKQGVILSESPRAPLRLAFPAKLASRWMPGLFPPKNEA